MEQVRPRLETFAAEMLGGLARADQRATGEVYLRGLMLDGKRKSMQPMAARLDVDHQRLQQFVTSSTWDHVEVRKRVARWADTFIDPDAYVIDDTGFPKDGSDSPGVARMYSGTLGKVGNCQIGVSVHAVTDAASAAINWALFLPKSWDDTTVTETEAIAAIQRRRARCRIPDHVRHREKWRQALDMLDQIIGGRDTRPDPEKPEKPEVPEVQGWGLLRRPVVADAGYGDITGFRLGLEQRDMRVRRRRQGHHQRLPRQTPSPPRRPTPVEDGHRNRGIATTRATSPPSPWPPDPTRCSTSPGATAPA